MKTEQVRESHSYLAHLESLREQEFGRYNAELLEEWIETQRAVVDGRLIHPRDDSWSWEVAFPIVGHYKVDGWEFEFRGYDERYMLPSNGASPWITARLVTFTRGRTHSDRSGSCIECGVHVDAGSVELVTPSGRKFYARYRDDCGCPAGGPPNRVGLSYNLDEAVKLLLSYLLQGEKERGLKVAASSWYRREPGSMGRLKAVIRGLGLNIA